MGVLEIHFHDSEFVFRPSMSIGPEGTDVDDIEETIEADEPEGDELVFPNDAPDGGSKRGLLAGLALLAVLLLAVRRLRGGNDA